MPGRAPGEGGAPEAKVIPGTEGRFGARLSLQIRRPAPAADFLGDPGVPEGKEFVFAGPRAQRRKGEGQGGCCFPGAAPGDGQGSWC